jgi:hypothetical protein
MQWSPAIFPDPGRFDPGHLPVRRRRAHLPRERVRQGGDAGGRAPHRDTLHVEARRRLRRQLLQVGEGIGAATWNREGIGGRGYLRTKGVLQLERAPRSSASRQSRRRQSPSRRRVRAATSRLRAAVSSSLFRAHRSGRQEGIS